MITQQKQSLESFVRVQAFTDVHPVPGPLTYAGARETLDEVVRRLREYAGAQITGRELSRGELRRQAQLVRQLIDRHMAQSSRSRGRRSSPSRTCACRPRSACRAAGAA
jgi:hypothetical protein